MDLGFRKITQGDVRRYEVDYSQFLPHGAKLKSPTGTIGPTGGSFTSSIGAVSLDVTDTKVFIFITGGTALNEKFTVTLQVQDTFNETVNDTLNFTVVAP
jgi:hypothetical protein